MEANDDLPLQFTIEILSVHFLTPGRYFLILKIVGDQVNPSKVKLYIGNSQNALDGHKFTTETCLEDGDPETLKTFIDPMISFWMPPGWYSNAATFKPSQAVEFLFIKGGECVQSYHLFLSFAQSLFSSSFFVG